jgi:hypothetical protein
MKNWETSAAGVGIAAIYAGLTALQSGLTMKDALVAAGLALVGVLAKDANVTGGTIQQ